MTIKPVRRQLIRAKGHWQVATERWRDQLAGIDALPQLTLLGLLTGILAGFAILLFRLLIELPLHILLAGQPENFEALAPQWQFLLPVIGAVVLGLALQKIDSQYHATGVAHVLDRLNNHQGRMPLGNVITQLLGGAFCLVTGQSVGREGPAVHIGAGSGSLLGQWLKLPNNSLRPLAGCGVAAAIAASFNTPMAGVIFAMEVVVMEYSIAGFIPVILAAVAGTTINQLAFGSQTIFNTPSNLMGGLYELPFMAIAGLIVGVFASTFIRLQTLCCKASLNRPVALRFAVAGVITGCGALIAPQIMGVGYDTIDNALTGNLELELLLGILGIKLLVTGVGLGVGMPGGVIGPLLFMGACIGGAAGIVANQLMPASASVTGFYVILGMGAMMGAVLNAPLAAMMAILELTYNPNIIFPSMLMVVAACLTTRWVFKCDGLFQELLRIQGKKSDFVAAEQLLSRTGVRSLLDKHIKKVSTDISIEQAQQLLIQHPHWIVLDNSKRLLHPVDLANYIAEQDPAFDKLLNLDEIPARRLDMIELQEETNLYQALLQMNHAQVDAAYIRINQKPWLGILTRERINNYYTL